MDYEALALKFGAKEKQDDLEKLARKFGAKQGTEPSVAEDVTKSALAAVPKGVAGAYGLPADIVEGITGFGEFLAAKAGGLMGIPEEKFYGMGKPELPLPTSERLRNAVNLYEPQTEAGRRVGGIVEAGAGGVGLGGKAQLLPSLAAGVGMEGMGMATNDNPLWRLAGAFAAPTALGVASAYRSTPGQMVREATGPLTTQQIAEAKAKMEVARQQGIKLAGPEALPPSGIQQLMSDVAASPQGGRVINEFMAQRPAQVKAAVDKRLLDEVGAANTPDANMARARQAATDVISGAEKSRTDLVRPFYDAAKQDAISTPAIEGIIQRLEGARRYVGAANQSAIDDIIGQLRGTAPNAAAMDDTFKSFRTAADVSPINATSAEKQAASVYGLGRDELDSLLRSQSQNIRAGRDVYRDITKQQIEPLTSGPVGRVAGKNGIDTSLPENLNPISAIANEKMARPESIQELYSHLNRTDKQAFPGIARTWLENSFDQAAQKIQAGENRMVGANFAKAVYGTPQQEANFVEVMRGVAQANGKNPDQVAAGAKNLLEVLQLTGKVPGMGSPTGGRIAANQMASSSGAASVADSISAAPLTGVSRKLREWAAQGNYKALAEAMTAPDSVEQLARLAKYNPKTTTAQWMAAGILGLNGSDR